MIHKSIARVNRHLQQILGEAEGGGGDAHRRAEVTTHSTPLKIPHKLPRNKKIIIFTATRLYVNILNN